jgi:hypothetical protein
LVSISGLGSGVAFATEFAKGAQIIRESDTQIRIIGFSGVAVNAITNPTSGLNVTLSVTIDPAAFRVLPTDKTVTVASSDQVGVAEVTADVISLTSGTTVQTTSGVNVVITLRGGETFTSVANSGTYSISARETLIGSGANAAIYSGLTVSGVVSTTDSGVLTITITGTVPGSAFSLEEFKITIPAAFLTQNIADLDVLTGKEVGVLTLRPKLEIAIIE